MTKELVAKITKAAIDVGGKLKADKKNTEQRYDYLSADKILSICGQALFTNGVAVIPNLHEHEVNQFEYTDQYGKTKRRYDCKVKFEIIVTDGEGSFTLPWFGAGSDYSVPDKALYKAVTSGHKYFLMKLLCIGEGNEDGEHEVEGESPKPEQPAAKPAQQPEPTASMSLETASSLTSHDGVLYADMSTEDLVNRANSLRKAIPKYDGDKREQAEYKLAAIETIIKSRN